MNKLNQFIMEGKLSKWADYCEKNPAIDCYDDTDESLVIELFNQETWELKR